MGIVLLMPGSSSQAKAAIPRGQISSEGHYGHRNARPEMQMAGAAGAGHTVVDQIKSA
jgi:hypothetical protein